MFGHNKEKEQEEQKAQAAEMEAQKAEVAQAEEQEQEDKELIDGDIGSVGHYGFRLSGGKLIGSAEVAIKILDKSQIKMSITGMAKVELDAADLVDMAIDKATKAIPGEFDDAAGAALKALIRKGLAG